MKIRFMRFKLSAFLLSLVVLISACASTKGQRNIVIRNASSRTMNETTLHMGSYQSAFGVVPVRGIRYVAKYPHDFADRATLFWHAKGVERKEIIDVAGIVEGRKPGSLVITVYDDRVETSFVEDTGDSKR